MNELKFLTALEVLHDENKKQEATEYNSGYSKALYDVLQVSELCKEEQTLNQ